MAENGSKKRWAGFGRTSSRAAPEAPARPEAPAIPPVVLVSFADRQAVEAFGPDLLDLARICDLRLTLTPEVREALAPTDPVRQAADPDDSSDLRGSIAFANRVTTCQPDSQSFVLRLPLQADTSESEAASRLAVDTMASADGLARLATAFAGMPDLALVGPETLYKPMFRLVHDNIGPITQIEQLARATLLKRDLGAFPAQAFAMSGRVLDRLRPVLGRYETLVQDERRIIPYGQTGSIGAAMDLVWAALALSDDGRLGLVRRRLDDGEIILRHGAPADFVRETGRSEDQLDTLRRQSRARQDFDLLMQEQDFQADHYLSAHGAHIPETFSPLEHYVLYGDAAYLSGTSALNVTRYRLALGSRVARFDNTLCHWIVRGRPETELKTESWMSQARARRFFDADWLARTAPELGKADEIEERFLHFPELWGRPTSPKFNPRTIPVLAGDGTPETRGGLQEYLCHHYRDEEWAYEQLHACLQERRAEEAGPILADIRARYGDTFALVGARAYLAILDRDWNTVSAALNQLWRINSSEDKMVRHRPNLLNDFDSTNAHAFETVEETSDDAAIDLSRVCIYTTLFGDTDALLPNMTHSPGMHFVCFSDRPREAPGWEVRIVEPKFESSNRSAKFYKLFPHEVLPEFDASLFVDGNTLMLGDMDRLVTRYLAGHSFVMWPHPERADIYREAVAILQSGRHRPKEIFQQIQAYAEQGLPDSTGLTEGSFIWRRHDDRDVRDFMRDWWSEILSHSARDQLSLGYLFWRRQQKPRILPSRLGTSRRNAFFLKLPHRNPKSRERPSRKAPVTFLFHPQRKESGSTVMRGEQLSAILNDALTDREISYSTGLCWHGRVLFLTKGFLEKTSVRELQDLRAQRNFLIGDFVDAKPDDEKAACLDVLTAASITGYEYFAKAFPKTPVFHLTHHVDPRIAPGNDAEGFAPGYVGEEVNAVWTEEIRERVALIQVNTKIRDDSWLQNIRSTNFHYAVRNARDIDGFKPFLKGFTAARCKAPILTQKTTGDAIYYLGEDYPFFLPANPTEEEIIGQLDLARSSFGNPLWRQAMDRMRQLAMRSSDEMVIREFRQILDS